MKKLSLLTIASLLSFGAAQAQVTINWDNGGAGNAWSTPENWAGDNVPDTNGEAAAFVGAANVAIDVDQDFTINNYTDSFGGEGFTHTLYGAGTLTIDRSSSNTQLGVNNATGNAGGTLRLNGRIAINNSGGGTTTIQNSNSTGNILLFDTGSNLTINTLLQTVQGVGGSIQMNGTFASSGANLQINSTNVSFGAGHNSTAFGRDIVMLANSKLAVDGGTVLNTGRKFQVNGTNTELELNGADAINDANIVVSGSNGFLLDVNADQTDMGLLVSVGTMTIDLDPSVTLLAFNDSSAQVWLDGTIAITGFQEGVIRFGTDANGLNAAQLSAIDGGAYTLDSSGFLTAVPEPSTFALLAGGVALGLILVRRRRA